MNDTIHIDKIKGYLTMKRDPNGELIGKDNMIFRGEVMLNNDWVIGLVVGVGENCYN